MKLCLNYKTNNNQSINFCLLFYLKFDLLFAEKYKNQTDFFCGILIIILYAIYFKFGSRFCVIYLEFK